MDYQVDLSPSARADLRDIVRYISYDNPDEAERFGRFLISRTRLLVQSPELGRIVPEFEDPVIREIIIRAYRVVYRVDHSRKLVEVIRFWRASRDVPEINTRCRNAVESLEDRIAFMAKTLLYHLFGVGKIPAQWRATIESEGVVLIDEGIGGTVTYRDFRSPGRIASWKKSAFSGAIALTRTRLLALQFASPVINVPLNDDRLQQMQFSIEGEDKILIAFNANLFHDDWSGTLEYRFRTPQAAAFVKSLSR